MSVRSEEDMMAAGEECGRVENASQSANASNASMCLLRFIEYFCKIVDCRNENGCGGLDQRDSERKPDHLRNRQTLPISCETGRTQHSFCIFGIEWMYIFSPGWILQQSSGPCYDIWTSTESDECLGVSTISLPLPSLLFAARRGVGP